MASTKIPRNSNSETSNGEIRESLSDFSASDRPIEHKADDALGRTVFAESIAHLIKNWQTNQPCVISLSGEWGSGKTSVINLIVEILREEAKGIEINKFEPWMFSNINDLTTQFFELYTSWVRKGNGHTRKLIRKIQSYRYLLGILPTSQEATKISAGVIALISVISLLIGISLPSIPANITKLIHTLSLLLILLLGVAQFSGTALSRITDFLIHKAKAISDDPLSAKEQLDEMLSSQKMCRLIIIDDIDRLTKSEVSNVLQLVKKNADFSKTIYLLAFDKRVVERTISNDSAAAGREYLKKIIQFDFSLPIVSEEVLHEYLLSRIVIIVTKATQKSEVYFSQYRWSTLFQTGIKYYFVTLRDVKRYVAAIEVLFPITYRNGSMELNPIDFLGVEALRMFNYDLYEVIKNSKDILTNISPRWLAHDQFEKQENEDRKRKIEDIFQACKVKEFERIIVFALFPQVAELLGYSLLGVDSSKTESIKNLQICAKQHFDLYFSLDTVDSGKRITQHEIDNVLAVQSSLYEMKIEFRRFMSRNKIQELIDRLWTFARDSEVIQDSSIPVFIQTLFDVSDELPPAPDFIHETALFASQRLIFQLLDRLKDKGKVNEILANTISNSEAIMGPLEKIVHEVRQLRDGGPELQCNAEDVPGLVSAMSTKLRGAHEKILCSNSIPQILSSWKEIGDEKGLSTYIAEVRSNNADFVRFTFAFIFKDGLIDRGPNVEPEYLRSLLKILEEYIPLHEISDTLQSIDDISDSIQQQKEKIMTALKQLDAKAL